MLYRVTYRSLVGEPHECDQTPDQAAIGIGDAIVAGFRTEREETRNEDNQVVVTVRTISPSDVLFGEYIFTRLH